MTRVTPPLQVGTGQLGGLSGGWAMINLGPVNPQGHSWQVLHAYRQQELHFAGAVCSHNVLTLELNGDRRSYRANMDRVLLGPSWSLCLRSTIARAKQKAP